MAERKSNNIRIGEFYSMKRFVDLIEKSSIKDKNLLVHTDRNSEFGFFYGEENCNKGTGNKGNQILLGTAQSGTELVKYNLDTINNKENCNKRMEDIIGRIRGRNIDLEEFKAIVDSFFDISFMSVSACTSIRDKTLEYRNNLEKLRESVHNEVVNANGTEYGDSVLEQYCNDNEMPLPEDISVQSLHNWKTELQAKIAQSESKKWTIEDNNKTRRLRRKLKKVCEALERKDAGVTGIDIEKEFPDMFSLCQDLRVKVTGFQYFDMICHQDVVYDVMAIEVDREAYDRYFNTVFDGVCELEREVFGAETYFRTLVEKQDMYVLQNPDYVDVENVREFVTNNRELVFEIDLRKSMEYGEFCVICVKEKETDREMLQGEDLYKKAKNYYGPYRQEYVKMSKENIHRAISSACLCIASCSSVGDAVGKLFDGILLQIVSLYCAKDYNSVKNLILESNWKFGNDSEEDSKRASILFICAKLLKDFTDIEKRKIGLENKSEMELYEQFYDLYRRYSTKNNREVQEFKLSSCWSMFIGNCCLELAQAEIKNVVSDADRIREYVKLAERDEISKKEAYLLHGELCQKGIVYKKDDIKAFDYFLKSELNLGMSNAVVMLNDMKKDGRYEDFANCWQRQKLDFSDPIKELYERYNGANADIYDLFVQQNVDREYDRASKDILFIEDRVKKYLNGYKDNHILPEELNISKHQIVIFGNNQKTEEYLSSFKANDNNTEIFLIDKNITDEEFTALQGKFSLLKDFRASVEQLIAEGKLVVFEIESICKRLCSESIVTRQMVDKNKLHFLFLNDDKSENLENAVKIFELTKEYQRKYDALFHRIDQDFKQVTYNLSGSFRLSECVELTIEVDSNDMELYIDNLQRETLGFYLPVRYLNYEEEIAKELLTRKPIFLPLLNSNREKNGKLCIAILGNDKSITSMIKMIISVGCFGTEDMVKSTGENNLVKTIYSNKIKLLLISKYADEIMDQLRYEAPALFGDVDYGLCSIESYKVDVKSGTFIRLFTNKGKSEQILKDDKALFALTSQMPDVDYYICAMEQDKDSVKLAQKIRTLLYSTTNKYKYSPIITALCRDTIYARRNEMISVGGNAIKGLWHTDYQVYFYGMLGSVYSRNNLDNNEIQKLALKIHCSYADRGWKAEDEAKNNYYCSAYYRESSMMAALYSIYRCYSAGMYKEGHIWRDNNIWDNFSVDNLKIKQDEQQILRLAVQEHIRWCGQMIVRSWQPVLGREQMENYLIEGAKSHQLFVGKIHPYLATWEELGERGYIGASDKFQNAVESFHKCTGTKNEDNRVSLIYFIRNVLRPYCEELLDAAKGEYTGTRIEYKADIYEEMKTTLEILSESGNAMEQLEYNPMNGYEDENQTIVCSDVKLINEKFRIWIEKCREIINENAREDYKEHPISFYKKMKLLIPELQKASMDVEKVLSSSDYMKVIYMDNSCFQVVNQWLLEGKMSNYKVTNVVRKITDEYVKVLHTFMKIISEESGEGIQLWTDSLLWKYLPDKISKLSVKETNIEMVKDSLELYKEMIKSECERTEYSR